MEMDIVKSKLKILKMSGALTEIDELYRDALKNQKDYLELINSLLEVEINDKYARRINNRIKKAKFPVSKSVTVTTGLAKSASVIPEGTLTSIFTPKTLLTCPSLINRTVSIT